MRKQMASQWDLLLVLCSPIGTLRSRTRRLLGRGDRGTSPQRGRRCKRGKFKLRFATRWGQYQYIINKNPYEGFTEETRNGFLPKTSRITATLLEEEIIDDEEFLVLHEAYAPQNLPFQPSAYEKFSLENKNSAECKADFRVNKRDIAFLKSSAHLQVV